MFKQIDVLGVINFIYIKTYVLYYFSFKSISFVS